jgi:hypothetical protein
LSTRSSIARPRDPVAGSTWLVLALREIAALYLPLLLLSWLLLGIWRKGGIARAHRIAAVASLVLLAISRALLAYTIVSGFSNR